jgi:hypothetical protein
MFLGDLSPFSVLVCSHPRFPKKSAVPRSHRLGGASPSTRGSGAAGSIIAAAEAALSWSNGSVASHDLRPGAAAVAALARRRLTSDLRLLRSVAALADSRLSSFSS